MFVCVDMCDMHDTLCVGVVLRNLLFLYMFFCCLSIPLFITGKHSVYDKNTLWLSFNLFCCCCCCFLLACSAFHFQSIFILIAFLSFFVFIFVECVELTSASAVVSVFPFRRFRTFFHIFLLLFFHCATYSLAGCHSRIVHPFYMLILVWCMRASNGAMAKRQRYRATLLGRFI